MKKSKKDLKQLVAMDKNMIKLPKLSDIERDLLESEHRFEVVYHSNKLEGNTLTKEEAKKAVLSAK